MIAALQISKEQSIEVDASMACFRIYRSQFGHDILPDLMSGIEAFIDALMVAFADAENIEDVSDVAKVFDPDTSSLIFRNLYGLELTTVFNLTWAMAKNAHDDIPGPEEWEKQFDRFPLDIVVPGLFKIIGETYISEKNWKWLKENVGGCIAKEEKTEKKKPASKPKRSTSEQSAEG
jgi:hypothetical protein